MSANNHLFESSLAVPRATSCLEALIREHLDRATQNDVHMTETATSPLSESNSSSPDAAALVNEIGDYLAQTAVLWSQLTESLMKGPHIDRALLHVHEAARQNTRLSDLSAVTAMDVSIGRLRKIRDLTSQYSRDVRSVWHSETSVGMDSSPIMQASVSPYHDLSSATTGLSGMSDRESRLVKSRKQLPDNPAAPRGSVAEEVSGSDSSDESDDDEDQFASIDMEALRQRGKGTYFCPKGLRCDKGGVDKDGNLVIFDRNSSFAQHCNKHRKPWRCDVPGCPNPPKKRKFARRDGLERHKAMVKHYLMT